MLTDPSPWMEQIIKRLRLMVSNWLASWRMIANEVIKGNVGKWKRLKLLVVATLPTDTYYWFMKPGHKQWDQIIRQSRDSLSQTSAAASGKVLWELRITSAYKPM